MAAKTEEKKIKENLLTLLKNQLPEKYDVLEDEIVGADSQGKLVADLAIKNKEDGLLFLIVITSSIQDIERKDKDHARKLLQISRASSILITNGEEGSIYLFFPSAKKADCGQYKWKSIKKDEFISYITNLKNDGQISFDAVWDAIKQILPDKYKGIFFTSHHVEVNNDHVSFDEQTEDSLFRQLITIATQFDKKSEITKDNDGIRHLPTVLRYTSFASFTRNFIENTESMACVIGMNDRSECFFLNQSLDGSTNIHLSNMKPQEIDDLNKSYIVSCCDIKKEDLTMWRLYGDDGKGVRLKYTYYPDSVQKSTNFILLPVVYENKHKDLVKALKELFRMKRINGRYKFVFNRLSIWKYFFKSSDYSVEEEIRLLFKYDKKNKNSNIVIKWVKNDSYNIIHPIVIFKDLKDFPLKLKAITLGPKCAEKDSNKAQLQQFIREYRKDENIEVKESTIKHYR